MAVLAFDPHFEQHARGLPVLTAKAPTLIIDELDSLLEAVEVDVAGRRILALEVQVVGGSAPVIFLVGGLDHKRRLFKTVKEIEQVPEAFRVFGITVLIEIVEHDHVEGWQGITTSSAQTVCLPCQSIRKILRVAG
jgi:hypothetical protein